MAQCVEWSGVLTVAQFNTMGYFEHTGPLNTVCHGQHTGPWSTYLSNILGDIFLSGGGSISTTD